MIRQKYSSPSASDVSDREDAKPRVLAVDTGIGDQMGNNPQDLPPELLQLSPPGPRGSAGASLFERSGSARGGFFPQPPPQNPYSTSASDSEDAPQNQPLSKAMSQSRTSLASQSSTLTNRSTNSGGGGLRRNRHRSSMASTKSSASDRTLEPEEHLLGSTDTLTEVGDDGPTAKTSADSGLESQVSSQLSPSNSAGTRIAPPKEPLPPALAQKQQEVLETIDPTAVAQKVLEETFNQRMALEGMQRWSVHKLKQQQVVEHMQNYMQAREGPSPMQSISPTSVQSASEAMEECALSPVVNDTKREESTIGESPSIAQTSETSFIVPTTSTPVTAKSSETTTEAKTTPKVPPALRPKPKPVMANSLRDTPSSTFSYKPPNRTIHEDIIETQMNRMELATIPESSLASSTDTDTETIRSSMRKGNLKSGASKGAPKVVKFKDEVEVSEADSSDSQIKYAELGQEQFNENDEVFEEVPVDVGLSPANEQRLLSKPRPVNIVTPTSAFTPPSIPKRPPPAPPAGYVRPPPPPYPGKRQDPPAYGSRSPAESGGSSSDEVTFRNKLQQASKQFFPVQTRPTKHPGLVNGGVNIGQINNGMNGLQKSLSKAHRLKAQMMAVKSGTKAIQTVCVVILLTIDRVTILGETLCRLVTTIHQMVMVVKISGTISHGMCHSHRSSGQNLHKPMKCIKPHNVSVR